MEESNKNAPEEEDKISPMERHRLAMEKLDEWNLENESAESAHSAEALNPISSVRLELDDSIYGVVDSESGEKERPVIPDIVYEKLPSFLKKECDKFEGREKDIFLLSILTIFSGITENVYGVYRKQKSYSNLYFFLIALPGAGKGSMIYAKQACSKIHRKLQTEIVTIAGGEERRKTLFIPANSSSAALLGTIKVNEGRGVIFDTEADTLNNALNQKHGGFSDILRKGFHHEPISDNKNSGNGFIEIEKPRITICLSGTPGQVKNLMESVENGLLSRFFFLNIEGRAKWKDVFEEGFSVDYFEKEYADELYKYYDHFKKLGSEIRFKFTPEQKIKFNEYCSEKLYHVQKVYPEFVDASLLRIGPIVFRICMILTAIRQFETCTTPSSELICNDDDYEIGLKLFQVFFNQAINTLKMLPNQGLSNLSVTAKYLYNEISTGKEYQTATLIELGTQGGTKKRSVQEGISSLLAHGLLIKIGHGVYIKHE